MIVQFNELLPVPYIDAAAAVLVIILAVGLVYKIRRWLKVLPSTLIQEAKRHIKSGGMVTIFLSELVSRVVAQKQVITDSRTRMVTHMLVFWGFLGLAFATVWDAVFYTNGTLPAPFTAENFGNVVGNIGGALVLIGMTIMILRYLTVDKFKDAWKGDLIFLGTLYLATITGFTTEGTRFSADLLAYSNYAIHLAFVAVLIASAPFTHFFHAVLTPLMRYAGRLQSVLTTKGVTDYPYYKKMAMVDLAEDVRSEKVGPTYPSWLREAKETTQKS